MKPSNSRTIAIASGKGGVGKTVITANLALSLAQQFRGKTGSVVAVDLDLGCGNLNACRRCTLSEWDDQQLSPE